MADGVKLGEKAIEQLRDVVHHGRLRYENDQPAQPRRTVSQAPIWQAYKVTSGPSSGIWTGSLILWDGTTETVITTGVKGVLAFGTTATAGSYYPCRLVGVLAGVALFLFWRTPDGMTGTQTIVTAVSCSGSTLSVTTKVMTIEDGLIISIA